MGFGSSGLISCPLRGVAVLKKVLFSLIGFLALLVAAVLIGPGLIDWNQYKGEIAAQAKAITGRDLTIDGDIQITVLPAPALVVKDVALANLEGATSPEMAPVEIPGNPNSPRSPVEWPDPGGNHQAGQPGD